jgi:hypothetical protein
MSSVIEFLERMGADAQLRHASQDEIAVALEQSQIDSALGAAIIARSTADLYSLLDLRPMFHTLENPGREDEDEEGEGEDEGEEEKDALAGSTVSCRTPTSIV